MTWIILLRYQIQKKWTCDRHVHERESSRIKTRKCNINQRSTVQIICKLIRRVRSCAGLRCFWCPEMSPLALQVLEPLYLFLALIFVPVPSPYLRRLTEVFHHTVEGFYPRGGSVHIQFFRPAAGSSEDSLFPDREWSGHVTPEMKNEWEADSLSPVSWSRTFHDMIWADNFH